MKFRYMAICLCFVAVEMASLAMSQDIAYKKDPNAAARMTLLLRDFEHQANIKTIAERIFSQFKGFAKAGN